LDFVFQKPHPPIWIGGNNDLAIQRALKYGGRVVTRLARSSGYA